MSNTDEPTLIILAPEEPDLEKMQGRIMDMLENGKSVNDISISLQMDPEMVQGYADKLNKEKWKCMSNNDMRGEHILMLNEMAELGKLQYMADPKPPHAFAVASILKTANEIFKDMELADNLDDLRDRAQDEVLQATMEQLVICMTKEIGQARKNIAEMLPSEKKSEGIRIIEDVAKALAIHAKTSFDDGIKNLERVFEDASSRKNTKHKKNGNNNGTGIVSLVPHFEQK